MGIVFQQFKLALPYRFRKEEPPTPFRYLWNNHLRQHIPQRSNS